MSELLKQGTARSSGPDETVEMRLDRMEALLVTTPILIRGWVILADYPKFSWGFEPPFTSFLPPNHPPMWVPDRRSHRELSIDTF